MINYKLRLFTPCSSYGAEEMTPNRNYAYVHFRIQSDTKAFEYAACGHENFRIRKKIFAEKKFSDTCGHGLENGETKNLCFVEITVEILPAFLVKEHSNAPNSGSVNEGVAYLLLV